MRNDPHRLLYAPLCPSALLACVATLLGAMPAHSQSNYWVDPQCGSDFSPGTAAAPFQTINYALAVAAPGSTVHLYDGVYSQTTGTSFPILLTAGIGLVGAPGCVCAGPCGATAPIIDGLNNVPTLIELDPADDFAGTPIRGLTMRNANRAIALMPTTGTHTPVIEMNTFVVSSIQTGVLLQSDGALAPVIRDNSFQGSGNTAIYLTGVPDAGVIEFSSNDIQDSTVSFQNFGGQVDCMFNEFSGSAGIFIHRYPSGSTGWNPASRIEGNTIQITGGVGINISSTPNVVIRENVLVGSTSSTAVSVYSANSSLASVDVTIVDNLIEGHGTGIANYYAATRRLVVSDNIIRNNFGDGIRDGGFEGTTIAGNLIFGNGGHGIHITPTNPSQTTLSRIERNTIADNAGNGIFTNVTSSYPPYVNSCIIWGNGGCDIAGLAAGQYCYSCIGACASPLCSNINADPLFQGAPGGDYCLLPGSPCVDAGDPALAVDCDGSRADIGALALYCGLCGFTYYCAADGSGSDCPCGNENDGSVEGGQAGCANSASAGGAAIRATGSPSVAAGDLVLGAVGLVPSVPGLYYQGDNAVGGGSGAQFGDGLRCVGGGVIRLEIRSASPGGSSQTTIDIADTGGASAGETKYYQLWYRDPTSSPCGSSFNLTDAVQVVWQP